MVEEWTMSTITWLNTAKHSNQKISTLQQHIQICQWHRYHPNVRTPTDLPFIHDPSHIYRMTVLQNGWLWNGGTWCRLSTACLTEKRHSPPTPLPELHPQPSTQRCLETILLPMQSPTQIWILVTVSNGLTNWKPILMVLNTTSSTLETSTLMWDHHFFWIFCQISCKQWQWPILQPLLTLNLSTCHPHWSQMSQSGANGRYCMQHPILCSNHVNYGRKKM